MYNMMDKKPNGVLSFNISKVRDKLPVDFRCKTVFAALIVRSLLILHNILAIWRVVITRNNPDFWVLGVTNVLLVLETVVIIRYNGGTEWKWWCPCFLTYLLSVLPSIWLLQLSQYSKTVEQNRDVVIIPSGTASLTGPDQTNNTGDLIDNITGVTTVTEIPFNVTTDVGGIAAQLNTLIDLEDTTWIVVIQESLVYILVFGRWWLPRGEVSREALSDLLLEYLAIASDIMELYAVFDEDVVQSNLGVTYAILAIWSISFFQFVPVLVHKKKYQHFESPRMKRITRACGEFFSQVVVTCLSVFLQDAPFLCLRLYIIIHLNLVTYSLIFFVLKNIVTLMLLFYRLTILCVRLPCCYYDELQFVGVKDVDFSTPIVIEKKHIPLRTSLSANNIPINPYLFYTQQGARSSL